MKIDLFKINKILVLSLFLLITLPSFVSAISLEMKDNFNTGETMMIKFSGTFVDNLQEENIFFYRNQHTSVPLEFELTKIRNEYYLYSSLIGKTAGNYSIVLKNIRYISAGQTNEEEIQKNFTILESIADFSINPGFVIAENNFYIEALNLQDQEITIDINFNETEEEPIGFFDFLFANEDEISDNAITLIPGETKKIYFNLENITNNTNNTIEFVRLSTNNLEYEIPIEVTITNIPEELKEKSFKFEPQEISVSMYIDDLSNRIVYLFNNGEADLENISLSISESLEPYLELSEYTVDELKANKSLKLSLNFTSDSENKSLEGFILAKLNGFTLNDSISIDLVFFPEFIPLPENNQTINDPAIVQSCEEIQGVICEENFICNGETEPARDGLCCLAECEQKIDRGDLGKTIGWLLVFLVILALFWFFKQKYLGVEKKKINFARIAKGKK